jgi:RimJ/RimL family protein N-acetyltransferase
MAMTTDADPRITIRETTAADLPDLVAMWNDGRVMRWVGYPDGLGIDERGAREWFAQLRRDPERHHFVVSTDDLAFAGELYYRVEREHRRAALDIKLRAEAHGRGIGRRALAGLCERVWTNEAEVDAVWVEPHPENEAARRLYRRLGFAPGDRPPDLPSGNAYWELRRAPR